MVNSNPPVTVLIPTYNRAKTIGGAVESCLAQTYNNLSVLVYDDGSTDATDAVVRKYDNPPVRVIYSTRNRGVAVARNALLDETKTEFNCLLDSDDIMNPWKIELQMQAMLKWSPPFVRTGARNLNAASKRTWREAPGVYYAVRQTVPTSLFRKSWVPRFNPAVQLLADDVLWETEIVLTHGTGILLPFLLYLKGRGKDRLSAQVKSAPTQRCLRLFEKLRAPMLKELGARGINGKCRVECARVDDLEIPFPVSRPFKPMFAEIIEANRLTSRRIRSWM